MGVTLVCAEASPAADPGKTVHNFACLAHPSGPYGYGWDFSRPAIAGIFLVGFACSPLAIHMGFVQDELVAILVMLGSATTVNCFIMARNMGHEGTLTSAKLS